MHGAMMCITSNVHVVLGHHVNNITKFQSCRCDTLFLTDEKTSQQHGMYIWQERLY